MLHEHETFAVSPYSPLSFTGDFAQILTPFGSDVTALLTHVFDQATLFSMSVNPEDRGVGSWMVPLSDGRGLVVQLQRMVPRMHHLFPVDLAFGLELRVVDSDSWEEELAGHPLPEAPGVVTPSQAEAFISAIHSRLVELLDGPVSDQEWKAPSLRGEGFASPLPLSEEFFLGPAPVQVAPLRASVVLGATGLIAGNGSPLLQVVIHLTRVRSFLH